MEYIFLVSGIFIGFVFALILISFKLLKEFRNYKLDTQEIKSAVKDVSELSKTLTLNQNFKGKFGEDCLEQIIKICYPIENLNYIKQFVTKNEDYREIKPDYVINLPNNKSIIIDSKLNLEKYIEYKENTISKAEFIKDLNATINQLSNKKYQSAINLNQPDFIIMYIPLEPVITLIYTDKDFLSVVNNAQNKNIIIAGNSSILTVIRLTKMLWAKDAQQKNINQIISSAQKIYDYIARHTQNLHSAKIALDKLTQEFNKEYEKLATNRLFNLVEELKKYGIEQTKIKNQKLEIDNDFLSENEVGKFEN